MKLQPLEFEKPIIELEKQLESLQWRSASQDIDVSGEIASMQEKIRQTREEIYRGLSAWQRVQIARHPARPYMLDYVTRCCTDWVEIHGDRHFGDDRAMPCGFATIAGIRCVIIGHQKGRDTKDNILRNFGCAHPEGYRKALRLMRLAEKFSLPIVALIDTPGAYPGIGAEERNIAEAIAFNLREMMSLRTPIVAVILGEGGSGGALGIGVADRVLMMENAYYSVISPEGCAAILWKHRQHAPEAAEALKITASDLQRLQIVDEVVSEPVGGAHHDHQTAAQNLKSAVMHNLIALGKMPADELLQRRYEKFRRFGAFEESAPQPSTTASATEDS